MTRDNKENRGGEMQTVTRRQPNLVIAQGMGGFFSCPEESRLLTGMKIECLFLRRLIFRVRRSLLACPPFGCTHCRVRRLQEKDTFISKQNVKSLVQRLIPCETHFLLGNQQDAKRGS